MNKRNIAYLAIVLLMVMGTLVFAATGVVEEKSVLAGTVIADHLAVVGQAVKEGDTLVCVDSIMGPATAARATTDGIVSAVLVKPGTNISTGFVVVKITAERK